MKMFFKQTKYFFYLLVIILFPLSYYRFFFRKGHTPFNDITVALKMMTTAFFCCMAYWCHHVASPPQDPGFMEKRHFRKNVVKGKEVDLNDNVDNADSK